MTKRQKFEENARKWKEKMELDMNEAKESEDDEKLVKLIATLSLGGLWVNIVKHDMVFSDEEGYDELPELQEENETF